MFYNDKLDAILTILGAAANLVSYEDLERRGNPHAIEVCKIWRATITREWTIFGGAA